MRALSVLNISFVIFITYFSIIDLYAIYDSTIVNIENFNLFLFIITLIAFIFCGIIILVFEKPFAKYFYIPELILYICLSTIIASPLISILENP